MVFPKIATTYALMCPNLPVSSFRLIIRFAMVFVALSFSTIVVCAEMQRIFTPEDAMRVERISQTTISPDGRWLAYVRERPNISSAKLRWQDRSDVWLVATTGGSPQNLTNGAVTELGYSSPMWSPESKTIAMLGTRDGTTQLWVYELKGGRFRQATNRTLGSGEDRGHISVGWLSNRILICTVLPEGITQGFGDVGAIREAIYLRTESAQRQGVTVSVLNSGIPETMEGRPQAQLLRINLDGDSQPLTSAAGFEDLRISPDRQYIAVLRQSGLAHPTATPFGYDNWQENRIYKLAVTDGVGKSLSQESETVNHVLTGSIRWSMDSKEIAFVRENAESKGVEFHVVRCQLSPWTCADVTIGHLVRTDAAGNPLIPAILWGGDDTLLVYAKNVGEDRWDWWAVSNDGEARNLTAATTSVPSELFVEPRGMFAVGLAGGKLQRIWINSGHRLELLHSEITSILWPRLSGGWTSENEQEVRSLIVARRSGDSKGQDIFRVDLVSGQMTKIALLSADTRLTDFSLANDMAVTLRSNNSGTSLTITRVEEQHPANVVEANTFLSQIKAGQTMGFEYQSMDGQKLNGWLLLPVNYQEGKHYPLVTDMYAGTIYGDSLAADSYTLNWGSSLNLQLLEARGYAVLLPSMPLKAVGQPSDPFLELTKGVLPAVDKAIEMGIADPERLAVMGHSFGGYSTYGLITQTKRFRAAVAMSGAVDLISQYGAFEPPYEYKTSPQDTHWMMLWAELGQGRMGVPPWMNPERYVRNSPLFYVERVETPLMMVHGDIDSVPMQQAEEFFTALYRQHKRAQLVRYWGEGHAVREPANVEDMWNRIYAWFDEFLDISRDQQGNLLWDGDKIKSRAGAPALQPEDFARFDRMGKSNSTH